MKKLSLWAERKWERYNFGPDYPVVMFWLITAIFLVQSALLVRVIVEYYSVLQGSILIRGVMMLVMYPLIWTVYYRLHKRLKRFSQEAHPSNERLLKEVQALTIALVVCAYALFGFGLGILRRLLEQVYY